MFFVVVVVLHLLVWKKIVCFFFLCVCVCLSCFVFVLGWGFFVVILLVCSRCWNSVVYVDVCTGFLPSLQKSHNSIYGVDRHASWGHRHFRFDFVCVQSKMVRLISLPVFLFFLGGGGWGGSNIFAHEVSHWVIPILSLCIYNEFFNSRCLFYLTESHCKSDTYYVWYLMYN